MTVSKKILSDFSILFPFILVFIGTIFLKINHPVGSALKMMAFLYMLIYVILKRKTDVNLLIVSLFFLPFLIYGVLHSFNINAGIEDGIRYLFPIVVLFYGYSIKEHLNLLIKFMLFFITINFLAQFINYFYWFKGLRQWYYPVTTHGEWYFNQAGGILRASGIVVYFAFLGFMNLIAFFVIKKYYNGKYKKFFLAIALIMMFASLSYKTILTFVLVLALMNYKRLHTFLAGILVLLIGASLTFPEQMQSFLNSLLYRLNSYILMKRPTVRVETYQIMFKEIFDGNWLGYGIGSFGGPASLKYKSPYYEQVHFTWPDTFWMKMTTVDTFPPHVFVELGIVGGLMFFLVLLSPIIKRKVNKTVLIIYFTLFFDMLFSFSLAGLEYLLFSLVLVYPIYYYNTQNNMKQSQINNQYS